MMQSKSGTSMTNLYTFFIILFIFILAVTGIQKLGSDLDANPNANLDAKSKLYIADINGIDIDSYNKTGAEEYESIIGNENSSGEAIKDFSIEYFFARDKVTNFEDRLGKKTVFNIPERVIVTLAGGSKGDFQWFLNIVNWFFWIVIGYGVYLAIRGIWTR